MFFELDDIKRRHTPYFDEYNTGSWITTPDSQFSWNYQRGLITGVIAASVTETANLFGASWQLLAKHYEAPTNLKQYGIYAREIFKMDNFRKGLKNRLQYAFTIGATDIAMRVAVFRATHAGFYKPWNSVEVAYLRKIPTSIFAAAVTSFIGVPFEFARLAYYGDKTFPKELQKGYKSYFNALIRIPFEEGPYYLFKNSFPLIVRNFSQTLTLFFAYDWLKDKFSILYRNAEIPYDGCKAVNAAFCTWLACIVSYPWGNKVREMVDFWPKREGANIFQGNYRKAAVWLWYHEYTSNYYPGLMKNYFWKTAPWMFLTLWISDSLGVFTYWSHNYWSGAGNNTWEDSYS